MRVSEASYGQEAKQPEMTPNAGFQTQTRNVSRTRKPDEQFTGEAIKLPLQTERTD